MEESSNMAGLSSVDEKNKIKMLLQMLKQNANKQGQYTCVQALLSVLKDCINDVDANEFVIFMLAMLLKCDNDVYEKSRFRCDMMSDVSTNIQNAEDFQANQGYDILFGNVKQHSLNVDINWFTCIVLLFVKERNDINYTTELVDLYDRKGLEYMRNVLELAVDTRSYELQNVATMLLDNLQNTDAGYAHNERIDQGLVTHLHSLIGIIQCVNETLKHESSPDYTLLRRCIRLASFILKVENECKWFHRSGGFAAICTAMQSAPMDKGVQFGAVSLLRIALKDHTDMRDYIVTSGGVPITQASKPLEPNPHAMQLMSYAPSAGCTQYVAAADMRGGASAHWVHPPMFNPDSRTQMCTHSNQCNSNHNAFGYRQSPLAYAKPPLQEVPYKKSFISEENALRILRAATK